MLRARPPILRWLLVLAAVAGSACGGGGAGRPPPEPGPPSAPLLTIAAVGDTIGYGIEGEGVPGEVAARIAPHDLFLFNHEGVTRDGPADADCVARPDQSLFLSTPAFLDSLVLGAVPVATLANNHVLDCGGDGIVSTEAALALRGISAVGAGDREESAAAPLRLTINGVKVGIAAFLAQSPAPDTPGSDGAGPASWFADSGPARVAALAAECDLVVVSLHIHVSAGWTTRTDPEQLAVVEEALDAGADLVFAHGPHVPQGVVVREGKVGFLSLGNFLFHPDYALPEIARRSVIAEVAVEDRALDVTLAPLGLDDSGRPRMADQAAADTLLGSLVDLSGEFGTRLERNGGEARLRVARGAPLTR